MPYDIKFNNDQKIIELTYAGLVTPPELVEALEETAILSRSSGVTRFLADCTTMVGGHSVFDLYALISLYESIGVPRGMKEAILLPSLESPIEDVKFYEIACFNKGYNVRVFKNIRDALSWLTMD